MQAIFAHSGETVSRQFHMVLRSILKLGKYYIKQVDQTTSFLDDNKWKWFEGVAGALDGTHIKMTTLVEDRPRYRDRLGDINTNVIIACPHRILVFFVMLQGEIMVFRYQENVPQASAYQNKCIKNWGDICTLFASDRATGEGAEQHEESATAMNGEIEGTSTSDTSSGGSNNRLKRDRLADAIFSFAESFKEHLSRTQGPPKPSSQEIYNAISGVLGISREQVLKTIKRFMNGTVEEFDMLKNLFEEEKLDWILLFISD